MISQNIFYEKIALITGSGRGIGRSIALEFAARGAHVAVNFFRNRQPAEETAAEIRGMNRRCLVVKANVADEQDLDRLFAEIQSEFGGLDYFISNAASGYNRPIMEQKIKGWDWTMNINARAYLFGAQRAASLMQNRSGSAIVGISSPGSFRVLPDYVVVGASKAALEAITRYLAVELAPLGINVNAVSPGIVLTDALRHFDLVRENDNLVEKAAERIPAGRLTTPEDVARVVAFLCSPDASMIRGQTILVDGGYTLPIYQPGE